ncbi:hypothetical protein ACFUYE_30135 [Micromonospora humida]|uniref:hypothetical protein n=1 Tax=Micromonospora humida TaxID=2809018 RepID=UPI0036710733
MAISSCSTCGTTTMRSTAVDHTGTLATCKNGHMNFDPTSKSDTPISTGKVKTKGQSAIGNGATVIGHVDGDYRKDKKKGK